MDRGLGYWTGKRALISGEKTAIVCHNYSFTYLELHQRCCQIAHWLRDNGIRKGDRVSGLLLNSHQFIELFFACAKLGAVFVPVNIRLTSPEVEYILTDAAPSITFYHDEFLPVVDTIRDNVSCQRFLSCGAGFSGENDQKYEALFSGFPVDDFDFDIDPEDLQLMLYTSGTTGRPKGAMLSHRNTEWNAIQVCTRLPMSASDKIIVVAPMFHAGGINVLTTPGLYLGCTLYIQQQFDPINVLETIEQQKINSMFGVPSMWQAVMQCLDQKEYDLSSLSFLMGGGAPCPLNMLRYFQEKDIPFLEGFGLTETAPLVCVLDAKDSQSKNGYVGKAGFHVDVRVVDENGNTLPASEVGELICRGPNVFKGYWNQPEETRKALKNGWFHTGDLAFIDQEGFIKIVDRKKDMLISGGENVYPAEVEQTIYDHPAVAQVAVIGISHETWQEVPCAIIVLNDGSNTTEDEIMDFCDERLARFKTPKKVVFIDEMPISGSGKMQKMELRKRFGGITVAR